MTTPGYFQHNISTLYPLLESNLPLAKLVTPGLTPNTIQSSKTTLGKTTSLPWFRFLIDGDPNVSGKLDEIISSTMVIFFQQIQMMIRCQNNYKRHLTTILTGDLYSTTDLANNRFALKQIYDNLAPFIKKLSKTNSNVAKELVASLAKQQAGVTDITKIFTKEHLKQLNRKIFTVINIECFYGRLLPYRQIIQSITTNIPAAAEAMRSVTKDVFSKIDFKKTYRALSFFHELLKDHLPIPSLDDCLNILYYKQIPLVEYPYYKMDRWRRSLKPGSHVELRRGTMITLGERLSPIKEGPDRRIIFKMARDPYVVVFYPNPHYQRFLRDRIETKACAVRTPQIREKDREGRWSTESYVKKEPLSYYKFNLLVEYLLSTGPMTSIDFSNITQGKEHAITLKPIYPGGNDYASFVESLIAYYNSGAYNKEYPTLFKFLDKCLTNAKPEHKEFFKDIARRAMSIPPTEEQSEIDYVIHVAIMNKIKVSPSTEDQEGLSNEIFNKRCHDMVHAILLWRKHYLKAFKRRSTPIYSTHEETKLINELIKSFPNRVRAWSLPPE